MVQANINGTAVHERHSPDYQVCVWVCAALQRHFSPMICLSLILSPSCSLSNYFVLVSPSQCLHRPWVFSVLSLQSSSILTKPSLIDAQRQPCTSLYHTCFPCPARVQFLHSLHVPAVLFQTAIMCLGVAQRGAERWLISIPPAIYLTFGRWWLAERQNGVISNVLRVEAPGPTGPLTRRFTRGKGAHTVYAWQISKETLTLV